MDKNKSVDAMCFGSAVTRFNLRLLKYPVHSIRSETMQPFKIGNRNYRAICFVLLNRKLAILVPQVSPSGFVRHIFW